jgi:spore coat polysaccharide biosynthesis protein SpsF (cytidylyltransferase family)
MREKTAIFVAVRLNSKRLKNKAMLMLFDEPLIVKLTKRIMKSKLASDVIWCTSKLKSDDRLEIVAKKNSIKIFRHAPKDVMKRFIYAARKFKVKNIVRVTGDNPLTDPEVIDFMIKQHLKNGNDYTS